MILGVTLGVLVILGVTEGVVVILGVTEGDTGMPVNNSAVPSII